jgi:hypothetical protein
MKLLDKMVSDLAGLEMFTRLDMKYGPIDREQGFFLSENPY